MVYQQMNSKNVMSHPMVLGHIIDIQLVISEQGVYKLTQFLAPIWETHPLISKATRL